MMVRSLLLLMLLGSFSATVMAQDGSKPAKRKRGQQVQILAQLEKKIAAAEPSDEQKEKLTTLAEEFKPKFQEVAKKYNEAISAETRKQLAEARKELTSAGKKRKELAAALSEKVPLSEEQKKASEEANQQRSKLQNEYVAKVSEILTPEQLAKAGIKAPRQKKSG